MIKTILLLNPIYVSAFWAIILFLSPSEECRGKRFLSFFMLMAFVLYVSHFFYFQTYWSVYAYLDGAYIFSSLGLVPMFYIYVRLLTIDSNFELRKHSKYFILPAFFSIVTYSLYFFMSDAEEYHYLSEVLPHLFTADGICGLMRDVYLLFRLVFIVQIVYYFIFTARLLKLHTIKIADYYSDIENKGLGWLQVLNISMIIAAFLSIVMAILGRENFLDSSLVLLFPSLAYSVLLFIFGYLGNKQRATYLADDNVLDEEPECKEGEDCGEDILLKRLIDLFECDKAYMDKSLKIWDVSEKLGTNRTYVSRLINRRFGQNFCSYVNKYRIEDVKRKITKNPNCPLDDIAEESGFGSVNSLYRAFQQHEGVSVSDYRRKNG